jgi:tetratricopeptide (TPR) repeat protein
LNKELKKPDEFVSFWTHLGTKIAQHRRKTIAAVVTLGVAGLGTWGATLYLSSKAAKATVAYARIERIAAAPLLPEKAEASDAAKEVAKDADDGVPRFKTEKERLEAAVQEADRFVAEFGSGGLGRKAMFGKAGRLLVLDKTEEAATIFETLVAGEKEIDLKAMELEGVATAKEASGKLDEAVQVYTSLAEDGQRNGTFYVDRALFAKARILEKQGKSKDAENVLREILEKVPKTNLRHQIDDRLAILTEK